MRDFAISLTHRPGALADATNALSLRGVNLRSVAAMTIGQEGLVRLIPDDEEAARGALRDANIRFEEHEVATVLLENRAGELTGLAASLAEAGVNVEAIYVVGLAGDLIELAVAADDMKKTKKLLEE